LATEYLKLRWSGRSFVYIRGGAMVFGDSGAGNRVGGQAFGLRAGEQLSSGKRKKETKN